jgi:ribonuclease T2
MPSPNLADKTKKDLAVYMPGYTSCLERHEWYKHGTCSAMDADTYFSTANRLVTTFAATSMGKYISANVGNIIAADDLLSEFEKDFGAGSRQSVKLHCAKGPQTDMLVEIRVYLAKPIHEGGQVKDMLVSPPPFEKGDCPQRFLVDKVD